MYRLFNEGPFGSHRTIISTKILLRCCRGKIQRVLVKARVRLSLTVSLFLTALVTMPLFTVPEEADEYGCKELGLSGERLRSREKIDVKVFNNSEDVSLAVAKEISDLIKLKAAEGEDLRLL